ncbi:YcgL domain-containing protein [Endozoicomonas sp.]|uniref:YcgL domain-containing protein n=1 Tax=Endozoicomonas sp. TaxID=1892382 RepID=UPI002887A06E|nr:YcgL domain-containing protein [Endozoicomonas sp.]
MKSLVSIYKSPKRDEMYLYVNYSHKKGASLEQIIPESLMKAFGKPSHVFDLLLTPAKKLARVDTASVLEGLANNGYYLQMPPADSQGQEDDYTIRLPDEFLSFNDPI